MGFPFARSIQGDAKGQPVRNPEVPLQAPIPPMSPASCFQGRPGQVTAPSPAWAQEGPPLALSLPLSYLLLLLIYINYLSPIIHPAVPTVICE